MIFFMLSFSLWRIIFRISRITPTQQIMEKCWQSNHIQNTPVIFVLFHIPFSLLFVDPYHKNISDQDVHIFLIFRELKDISLFWMRRLLYWCFINFWKLNLTLIIWCGRSFTILNWHWQITVRLQLQLGHLTCTSTGWPKTSYTQ